MSHFASELIAIFGQKIQTETLPHFEIACFFRAPSPCWRVMKTRWQTLLQKLTAALRDRLELALAIMALRHQLAVLKRSGKRPH